MVCGLKKNEGAKFCLSVITELKNRGVEIIFVACVDGLKGLPETINTVFPKTNIQLYIIHIVRNSLKFVSWNDRKNSAQDLKNIKKKWSMPIQNWKQAMNQLTIIYEDRI